VRKVRGRGSNAEAGAHEAKAREAEVNEAEVNEARAREVEASGPEARKAEASGAKGKDEESGSESESEGEDEETKDEQAIVEAKQPEAEVEAEGDESEAEAEVEEPQELKNERPKRKRTEPDRGIWRKDFREKKPRTVAKEAEEDETLHLLGSIAAPSGDVTGVAYKPKCETYGITGVVATSMTTLSIRTLWFTDDMVSNICSEFLGTQLDPIPGELGMAPPGHMHDISNLGYLRAVISSAIMPNKDGMVPDSVSRKILPIITGCPFSQYVTKKDTVFFCKARRTMTRPAIMPLSPEGWAEGFEDIHANGFYDPNALVDVLEMDVKDLAVGDILWKKGKHVYTPLEVVTIMQPYGV